MVEVRVEKYVEIHFRGKVTAGKYWRLMQFPVTPFVGLHVHWRDEDEPTQVTSVLVDVTAGTVSVELEASIYTAGQTEQWNPADVEEQLEWEAKGWERSGDT